MKRYLLIFLCFLYSAAFSQTIDEIVKNKPNPPRLVNDFAKVLTADQAAALEEKLVHYDDSTSTQIVIVTVKTLGDYPIEDAALKILRGWGVGNKKTNNGLVILAAIDDHKIRIETGYGMEGPIPDIIANQIIEEFIVPNFRQGNYYRGFDQAVDALIKAAAGQYKAPENYHKNKSRSGAGGVLLLIVIFIIIMIISRGGGRGGGGRAA